MKKIILLLIIFFPLLGFAQWSDDFSDGDFTNNPAWAGDDSVFNISTGQLHLNASAAGTRYLSTASNIGLNATWEFDVKFTFNPSTSNYCIVYLMSNTSDLMNVTSGYYVKIGGNGSGTTGKCISLYKVGNTTALIQGIAGRLDSELVNVKIKITRDENNLWTLSSDILGGNNYLVEGTVTDNTFINSSYFGIKCVFSKTRSTSFYFDNFVISGESILDTTPPSIISAVPYFTVDTVLITNTLRITFSEEILATTALNVNNYVLNNSYENPDFIVQISPAVFDLMFDHSLNLSLDYLLTVSGISDLAGNIIQTQQYPLTMSQSDDYGVVITEIMAKSSPVVQLPNCKYVEIYNRTAHNINLKNWSLRLNTNNPQKITTDVIFPAKSYAILCRTDSINLFSEFTDIQKIGISSFPSLTTSGGTLTLKDELGNVIHSVSYSDSWYKDEYKKLGGWSLEMIDVNNPCSGTDNWIASNNSKGGTPGKENSVKAVNPDNSSPYPVIADPIDSVTLRVTFSEALRKIYANNPNRYKVSELGGNPISAVAAEPDFSTVTLKFSIPMITNKLYYLIILDSILDCCNNMVEINSTIRFAIAPPADKNDAVINEILFYPYSGTQDFVEIYNRSEKILDLKNMMLCRRDSLGKLHDPKEITASGRLLLPEEYCLLSTNSVNLSNFYTIKYPENLFTIKSMMSMPSDVGDVILTNRIGFIIDEVHYNKSQHSKIITNQRGVSLERINFNRPSNDITNWHSAAQDAGFATPGYKNSQYSDEIIIDSKIEIYPEAFSPDNDGYDDILNISYKLDEPGYTATMSIFSSNGTFIKYIINNQMLGIEGNLTWDGFNNNNEICPIGIYILYVEMFNTDGKKIVKKLPFVLSKKN
ncbi:MAG: lamin tail domain-containing protein [Bacteroidales bacterium]|jgi:hypothetical protein|nr:lamin tail domain-containing protein [Bacteroidales bacterium]